MHVDILVSMVIYTIATIAFYLLGAGITYTVSDAASSQRHDSSTFQHLYANARSLVIVGLLRRRHRDFVWNHFRRHSSERESLRGHVPLDGVL